MILKLLLTVLLLYYIGVLWKYYRHDIAGMLGRTEAEDGTDEEDEKDEADEEAKKRDKPYTVIGKSTYRKGQIYEPEAKQGRTENQVDKTDTFVLDKLEMPPENTAVAAQDKAETDAQTDGENIAGEPEETTAADDDADYSDIEVDPDEDEPEEEEYVPTLEEMEEEEELGAYYPDGNPDFATGYTFEDLKKVHRIITTDDAGEEEKRQAREVLPAVMGSDIWDKMMDEFEGAQQRVARLMNNSNV